MDKVAFLCNDSKSLQVRISEVGATITSLVVNNVDIVHYSSNNSPYYGTIGRVCNRIQNGKFKLDNVFYDLAKNNGINSLHGGIKGFDKCLWNLESNDASSAVFIYISKHMEEGFPLELRIEAKFSVVNNTLRIAYAVTPNSSSNLSSIVNITNHSYFNLSGLAENVKSHVIHIPNAIGFLELNDNQIPTGKVLGFDEYPALDFRQEKKIGFDLKDEYLKHVGSGYDHFFLLQDPSRVFDNRKLLHAATVSCLETGIQMELHTTAPGFQMYSGNFLDGTIPTKQSHPEGFNI